MLGYARRRAGRQHQSHTVVCPLCSFRPRSGSCLAWEGAPCRGEHPSSWCLHLSSPGLPLQRAAAYTALHGAAPLEVCEALTGHSLGLHGAAVAASALLRF